jgi:hypothetical protein
MTFPQVCVAGFWRLFSTGCSKRKLFGVKRHDSWHMACISIGKPQKSCGHSQKYKEHVMKFQFGDSQLVIELSPSAFAWFHGHTQRMSLTSLSVLFVQFSLFARQPGLA